jgi:ribonuclease HII
VRIADSKCLSAQERERAFAYLTAHEAWGVGAAESALIDAEGILAATEQAMQRALAELRKIVTPTYLLIDGRDKFWFDLPHSSIIRGDQLEPSIAAASILAKVLRDRIMEEASERYPAYRFLEHKGYATPAHQQLLRIHGPCPLHRRSFLRTVCAI